MVNGHVNSATERVLDHFKKIELLEKGTATHWKRSVSESETRFRLWRANTGAHLLPDDPNSIDFKLRNAPEIFGRVLNLLEELNEGLASIYTILSGQREGETKDLSQFDNDEDEQYCPSSEIEELHLMLEDIITSLLKISVFMRKSISGDQFENTRKSAAKHHPLSAQNDISHVTHKFPKLIKAPLLARRLGEAMTGRRQYLLYAKDRDSRILCDPQEALDQNVRSENLLYVPPESSSAFKGKSTTSTTTGQTLAAVTKSSKIQPEAFNFVNLPHLDHFESDDNHSEGSSHSSLDVERKSGNQDVIDLRSLSANGNAFQCTYCRGMVIYKKQRLWRKHVLADLKAWVCTYDSCEATLFSSEDAWSHHEQTVHCRDWTCPICTQSGLNSTQHVQKHIEFEHKMGQDNSELVANTITAVSPVFGHFEPEKCPFCDEWAISLKEERFKEEGIDRMENLIVPMEIFQRHVSKHLVQLALFAVTSHTGEDSDLASQTTNKNNLPSSNVTISSKQSSLIGANDKVPVSEALKTSKAGIRFDFNMDLPRTLDDEFETEIYSETPSLLYEPSMFSTSSIPYTDRTFMPYKAYHSTVMLSSADASTLGDDNSVFGQNVIKSTSPKMHRFTTPEQRFITNWIKNIGEKEGIRRMPRDNEVKTLSAALERNIHFIRRTITTQLERPELSDMVRRIIYLPPQGTGDITMLISLHYEQKPQSSTRCHWGDMLDNPHTKHGHSCPVCSRTYSTRTKLTDHLLDQLVTEIFLCPFCDDSTKVNSLGNLGRVSTYGRRFVEHLSTKHDIRNKEQRDTIKKIYCVLRDDSTYECPGSNCPFTCVGAREWIKHMINTHPTDMTESWLDAGRKTVDTDEKKEPVDSYSEELAQTRAIDKLLDDFIGVRSSGDSSSRGTNQL